MDVVTLTAFLAPCLPFLLEKVGAPALDEASSKLGEDAWTKAKEIWSKLWPKVEVDAAAKVATEKLAEKPDSEAWKEAFQDELNAIFQKDSALVTAIAEILSSTQLANGGNQINQTLDENRGQVIGQMYGGEAKNIGNIDTVQGDVTL